MSIETEYLQRVWQLQYAYKEKKGETSRIEFIPFGAYRPADCLLTGGEGSGRNFLLWQTFNYAKERACDARLLTLLGGNAFFNDLSSEAALVFNLFVPIRLMLNEDPRSATRVLSNALRNYSINAVCEIGLYAFTDFSSRYLSAEIPLQAYVLWMDRSGGKHLTSLVVRYTPSAAQYTPGLTSDQCLQLLHTGLFSPALAACIRLGVHTMPPLLRPLLLTERYREVHALKGSSTLVLAPASYPGVRESVQSVSSLLAPESSAKVATLSLDTFVDSFLLYAPEFYKDAFQLFKDRYLAL